MWCFINIQINKESPDQKINNNSNSNNNNKELDLQGVRKNEANRNCHIFVKTPNYNLTQTPGRPVIYLFTYLFFLNQNE